MGGKKKPKRMDLIIVGGGAAGMIAGILAAREGLRVSILEKNQHFGKKLSITGNGKCNFTNAVQHPDCYRSDTPELAWQILDTWPVSATLALFQDLGIESFQRNGYYYPVSEHAEDVTKLLLEELERLSVTCRTNLSVTGVVPKQDEFLVWTEGYTYLAARVLLTTGGLAAPQHGTTGDGYRIASMLGHRLIPLCPALTALKTGEHPVNRLAGLRWSGKIRLYLPDAGEKGTEKLLCEEMGELQFTSYGISGIPAMQVSRYAAKVLLEADSLPAELDFCPEQSEKELMELIHKRKTVRAERSLQEWMIGWLPDKLGEFLIEDTGLDKRQPATTLTEEDWQRFVIRIKGLRVPITKVRSYDAAQSTAGGIGLKECSYYLESTLVPGLFFAGEILDVDGACGGYNLQWAWASASRAVEGIKKSMTGKGMEKV